MNLRTIYEHRVKAIFVALVIWTLIHSAFIADNEFDILAVPRTDIVQCTAADMAWTDNAIVTCEIRRQQ